MLAVGLLVAAPGGRGQGATPAKGKISGMWVWSDDSYRTAEQRARLIQFCREHQFNHIDVSVEVRKAGGGLAVADPEELTDLLARAAAAEISVSALRGSQRMFGETNWERTLGELQAVIDFNNRLPVKARLAGVKYDVEPHTTSEWREGGALRLAIMQDYLGCLVKMNDLLAAGAKGGRKLQLTVDIPFWWNKADLAVAFNGRTKPFSEHIQDLTDSLTLMSYRRDPAEVKKLVESERLYAVKIGKQVLPGLLHSQAKDPAEAALSFHGLPVADYLRARRELEGWASDEPGIGGVMHHHYGSLSNALETAESP